MFVDLRSHWHTIRVREASHIRVHLNIIKRDNGIGISDAWMPTIKTDLIGTVRPRSDLGTKKDVVHTRQCPELKLFINN